MIIVVRLGADDKSWLAYAKKKTVLSDAIISEARQQFENIAIKLNGEYDGWEVETP